jgi:MFS family permease
MLHIYLVASCLGLFGALFQPSLQASIPNVVGEGQVVAATAMVGATFNFAVMAGPALGGLLVAELGTGPVFALNAATFAVSAALVGGLRLVPPHRGDSHTSPWSDLVEGIRYSAATPLVRGMLIVLTLVVMGAASKAPLESLFVLDTLALGTSALGLVGASWGLGMIVGSLLAPSLARRWVRERLLAVCIAIVGAAVLAVSRTTDLTTILAAWLAAGTANAIGNVSYESLLQERTPDALRGRVFAASKAVVSAAFLGGAFLAGWAGTHLGVRSSYVISGSLLLLASALAWTLLATRRRIQVPDLQTLHQPRTAAIVLDAPGSTSDPEEVAVASGRPA